MADKANNILIRGVNWIGDAVMSIPAVKAIKKAFPDSKISLLVKPSIAPIFEMNPYIDEIILYEDKFKGFIGKLRLAKKLKKWQFSKAILFQNAFDAALIAFLAGIPERVGYSRDGRGFLLTKPVSFNNDDRKFHHIDYYLNLLKYAKAQTENSPPCIYLSIDERLSARNALSSLKVPILGINPGATYGSAKRWLPERFAEVASWFMSETNGGVVIFGGLSEVKMSEEIYKKLKNKGSGKLETEKIINLAGTISVRELIALISECDVFVTNDSGPMHIAYAVGTPLVAIFGSTSPVLTGPVGGGNVVIKANTSCSPCFNRTCKNNDMRCMYAISSDDVYFGIKEILPDKRAVFFDRDGTLCRDVNYLNNWSDFQVFSEIEGLKKLKDKGFLLIGISNQSGIARGVIDKAFVEDINRIFVDKYGFDGFYYCPHHPDEHCLCRKPEPRMLLNARAKCKVNLKESYIVGDKDIDMLLAKAVGAKGIFVLTGKEEGSPNAYFTAKDLKEVTSFIMQYE